MIPLRDSVPNRSLPVVTWALIGVNVFVFLQEVALGPELDGFIRTWGFVPARYFLLAQTDPGDWVDRFMPLGTSMFLHAGWTHLIGNMLYLWIFGDNVEDKMGHIRFLIFYLLCGVAGGVSQVWANPTSNLPVIGASGAIAGVLGSYLLLFPRAKVVTLVPLFVFVTFIEVPAIIFLGLWFFLQFLNGYLRLDPSGNGGGVAWWAHVGGFVTGIVLLFPFRKYA